jgi:2-dehydro-3-deoxygluconokinase
MSAPPTQVVTLGESMVLFDPMQDGSLAEGGSFVARVAGAESNTAIGLERLGIPASWVSVVGADRFGDFIVSTLRNEGVDVSAVRRDPSRQTGVFFKERLSRERTGVYYYRRHSAATGLSPADVPRELVRDARLLHVSGITMGLSVSAREAVRRAIEYAKEGSTLVSVDPNLRKELPHETELLSVIRGLLEQADIVLGGLDELAAVLGIDSPERILAELADRDVVARVGSSGALIGRNSGMRRIPPFPVEQVADLVGAGDAFNAGYLAARLRGFEHEAAAEIGTATASYAVRTTGDWEGLPLWEEIMALNGHRWAPQRRGEGTGLGDA